MLSPPTKQQNKTRTTKGHKEILERVRYVYYLDCADGYLHVSKDQIVHIKYVQFFEYQLYLNKAVFKNGGLPWWRSGWESACQCRGHGFEPWSGKIPHAAEQLGPWATTTEPARLEPVPRNGRGRDGERPTHRDEEWPPLAATRESPRRGTKTQHSHKLIN